MGIVSRTGCCGAILVACALHAPARGEEQHEPETVVVAPGTRYGASWPYRVFFGGQWRDAWTTPIRVRKLDLATFDGGLTPVRRGGGQQTKSLRLKGASGHSWAFRSIDKDPTKGLDAELREAMAAELIRDLTSTAHPVAALVVAPLLEVVGVLHVTPELFVMPDDPRLGEFRDFAGVLGMIELHPGRGFAGSDKALGTLQLFERLEKRSDERVDARGYLRARLMDILVGDWDRHVSQWQWLRFSEGGERVWRPVPRDRDQAFSRFDGAVPSLGEYYIKPLSSFHDRYSAIDKLTYTGWHIDRRILVALGQEEWRAVTSDVVGRLSDEAIASAVRALPPELHSKEGAALEKTLRARRDALPEASEAFYRLLADEVDVYATDQADVASIRRSREGDVEVTLSARDVDTGQAAGPPYFHRSFHAPETSEIRLYLLGGADQVVEEGEREAAIHVRIVRGDPVSGGDDGGAAGARGTGSGALDADEVADVPTDEERLSLRYERFRDWGADWLVFPQLSYDGTRGLFAGARVQRTHFGFGRAPFADQMNLAAAWSTALSEPRLEYALDVRTRSPVGALAYVAYSGVDFANFFGIGNETSRDPTLAAQNFYRVHQKRFVVRPLATTSLFGPAHARAGIAFERYSNTGEGAASGAYGSGDMSLGSVEVGVGADTRRGTLTRKRGVEADVSLRYYPPWFDNAAGFTKLRGEATALLGSPVVSAVLLGVRVAGEKNWGRYPFFEAASIGGAGLPSPLDVTGGSAGNLLRGYDLNRFAGDASVVANAELLIPLGRYSAIVPLRFGLVALADVGRVFVAQETSSRWHPAAGGGAWLALYAAGRGMEFVTNFNFAVVRSDEGTTFYLATSLGF